MDFAQTIDRLETEWDDQGFLGQLRQGQFDAEHAKNFLELLRSIIISDDELLPKRLVALLWYIPSFLSWQTERVQPNVNAKDYLQFCTDAHNILESVLGFP
jgi:hypothetical protein